MFLKVAVSTMYGPYFLIFYTILIVGTILVCRRRVADLDQSESLPPYPIPKNPDPYEVAYLRGGDTEVLRLMLFSLVQRGYLKVDPKKGLICAKDESACNDLKTQEEMNLFLRFEKIRAPSEIFSNSKIKRAMLGYCLNFQDRLEKEQLLSYKESSSYAILIFFAGLSAILGVGMYKLYMALSTGHRNVSFLIIMGIVGSLILKSTTKVSRLTKRGKNFLTDLQVTFHSLKKQYEGLPVASSKPSADALAVDPTLLLITGIYGLTALTQTPFATYSELFAQATANSSSSGGCGSIASCGSSGCGGGGCGGGGCGGCGG